MPRPPPKHLHEDDEDEDDEDLVSILLNLVTIKLIHRILVVVTEFTCFCTYI